MKMVTPQALPEGVSVVGRNHGIGDRREEGSLARRQREQRIIIRVRYRRGGSAAGLGLLRLAAAVGAKPAATAVPAPSRKLRRPIGVVSSTRSRSEVVVSGVPRSEILWSDTEILPQFAALSGVPRG